MAPATHRAPVAAADWSGCERRLIPVAGADLACWHRPGDGSRWVLWLHGACGSHEMWGLQVDAFPGVDHLFLDVRGQGESPMHTGRRVAFSDVVDDIGHVLDAYGLAHAVLVGHSWGGNPAQEFAYRYPERTDALVMVGAWGQLRPQTDAELRRIRLMTKAYRAMPWGLVARVNAKACSDEPATQALVRGAIRDTGRDVFLDLGLSAYEEVHDVDEHPAVPTLLIRGSDDFPKAIAPIYRRIQDRNPAAREVVIDGTRHQPMMDTPAAFDAAIDDLLVSLAVTT